MRQDHPGRFGLFAIIAPPDIEGSLKEIAYSIDVLQAEGIALHTSYRPNTWATLRLNRSTMSSTGARLSFTCTRLRPIAAGDWFREYPRASIEYATDSTRTIAHIVFSGIATKFPDIRWIFSHSGGTLPFLTSRFVRLAAERKPAHLPNGPLPEFRKFHYELAQGNTPGQIAALLKLVAISQVLYGTDFPFREGAEVNQGIADWGFSAADLRAIEHENAVRLMPRVKPV